MKKKIKDLTVAEANNICRKYPKDCKGCPFEKLEECYEIWHYIKINVYLKRIEKEIPLEQEIEVEDDD